MLLNGFRIWSVWLRVELLECISILSGVKSLVGRCEKICNWIGKRMMV